MIKKNYIYLDWLGPIPLKYFKSENVLHEYLVSVRQDQSEDKLNANGVYLMCSKIECINNMSMYCVNYIGGAPLRCIKERVQVQNFL